MSLIKKQIFVCNRCKAEVDAQISGSQYLEATIYGRDPELVDGNLKVYAESAFEDYFLCPDCLVSLINYINGRDLEFDTKEEALKNQRPPKQEEIIEYDKNGKPIAGRYPWGEPGNEYHYTPSESTDIGEGGYITKSDMDDDTEDFIRDIKASYETDDESWNPYKNKAREYTFWDDYAVDKIMQLYSKGVSVKDICIRLKYTEAQLSSLMHNIRKGKPGTKYYNWYKRYEDLLSKQPKSIKSLDLLDKILEMRSSGLSYNDIAIKLDLKKSNVYNIVSRAKNAEPGSEYHKIYEKWGV